MPEGCTRRSKCVCWDYQQRKGPDMGTRGTLAFKVDGVTKGAYNHYDSYPAGLGEEVLEFVKLAKDNPAYRELAVKLQPVPEGEPTPEIIEHLKPWTDLAVSTQSTKDWYCLLRGTQGDAEAILKAGYYEPFPVGEEDWSYVVDFDAEALEVWEGGHKVGTLAFAELPESLKDAGLPEYY